VASGGQVDALDWDVEPLRDYQGYGLQADRSSLRWQGLCERCVTPYRHVVRARARTAAFGAAAQVVVRDDRVSTSLAASARVVSLLPSLSRCLRDRPATALVGTDPRTGWRASLRA
jgi:hypothetical protein